MKLLFITQKLHGQDAFTVLWVNAFRALGYEVTVLCLEWKPDEIRKVMPDADLSFTVRSMGKENGDGKVANVVRFIKFVMLEEYDRVFVHMTPVWGVFGMIPWIVRRKPVYLWYTHYKMQLGLRLIGWYGKRLFCATPQSMPQYDHSPKKVVVGHGIDLSYWPKRTNVTTDSSKLMIVHRLSRSKRVEIVLRALKLLPNYTLDIYGIEAEPDYLQELKKIVVDEGLTSRVNFHGTVPMKDLPVLYTTHRLILNMASETIDKTMLEAMTCGCYPVTTKGNATAIGLRPLDSARGFGRQVGIPEAPEADTPEALAAFIERYKDIAPIDADTMYAVVEERHSLSALIAKMDVFIRQGS